jgi:hypothetical protein
LATKGRSGLELGGADQEKLEQIARVFGELTTSLDMTLSISALRDVAAVKFA